MNDSTHLTKKHATQPFTSPFPKQIEKQTEEHTKKDVQSFNASNMTTTHSTIDVNTRPAVDKNPGVSIEDLERRLAEARRFADEKEEGLRRLIKRNRNIIGLVHTEMKDKEASSFKSAISKT